MYTLLAILLRRGYANNYQLIRYQLSIINYQLNYYPKATIDTRPAIDLAILTKA
jgi:hypothetical protein